MFKKIIFLISLWIAKLISLLIFIFKLGQASNFPGKIALYIQKDLIINFNFRKNTKIVFVTGTNGKSTSCGLLSSILSASGKKNLYNKAGANLLSGIASTLSQYSDIFGNIDYEYILLEVDEATLPLVTLQLKPDLIAVTNLFRDQLDRFGELDTTAKLLEKGLNNPKTNSIILLNADDSRVAYLKTEKQKIYYGINANFQKSNDYFGLQNGWLSDPEETTICPICKSNLIFEYKTIAHLGNYKCSNCNFKRPEPNFSITNFKADNLTINFDISSTGFNNTKNNFFLPMIGTFNLYNALCSIAIAKSISNVTPVQIQKGLQIYSTIFGRGEKIKINNIESWIYLIKNPTGTTETLKTLNKIPNARFLIAINDNFADGRDISWLWDARFDLLSNHDKDIFVSGKRASDMALRLKYANINDTHIKVNENIVGAINKFSKSLSKDEVLYILPTYTALLELQRKGICKGIY